MGCTVASSEPPLDGAMNMTVCMVIAAIRFGLITAAQLAGGAGCFHQFAKQSQKWRMSDLDLRRM